jgi:hypothetical protein
MVRHQLKLHSAIAAVLVDAGARTSSPVWLSCDAIALKIAEYDSYRRPSDDDHPHAGQVAARVTQYPGPFDRRYAERVEIRLALR